MCFVIPDLEGLYDSFNTTSWSTWRSPVSSHSLTSHQDYTASTTLILGWPLVKHLGEILLLKILNTCEKYKQHSNHLPKLSTHPLHALKVHICPLASGYFITLFASTAPSLSLTPNPSTSVLLFLTLKACMTASIPRLDRPEGLQSVHIHSHPIKTTLHQQHWS